MKVTRLEALRQEKGWSKSELARKAQLQPGLVGWIEAGRFKPYEKQLRQLADALGFVHDTDALLEEVER